MPLDIILSLLNFGRKINFFGFFGRKTLERHEACSTFQAQNRLQKWVQIVQNFYF